MTQQKIILYQFESCPFCEKVRQHLIKKNLQFEKVEVPRDRENPIRKELFAKSKVPTVPVIKIDGKYIGESSDIIKFIDENF
jgi:glutaredoxin